MVTFTVRSSSASQARKPNNELEQCQWPRLLVGNIIHATHVAFFVLFFVKTLKFGVFAYFMLYVAVCDMKTEL